MRSRLHTAVLASPFGALALLAALRVLTAPDPRGYGTHEQLGLGACRFRDWLGGPCPTCGVTTAASHLVRGDPVAAWSTQPLGVILPLAALIGAVAFTVIHRRGGDLGELYLRGGRWFWGALLAVVATSWLLRA